MVGGAAIQPALASGALNIGWSNVVSTFQGHQEGFDYRFITSGALAKRGTNEVFGVQVATDSPIQSAKDLAGNTMATTSWSFTTAASLARPPPTSFTVVDRMGWEHPHPPCGATTDHADVLIVYSVSWNWGGGGTIACVYQGAATGAGPACRRQ